MMSGKDFLKSHVLSWRQTEKSVFRLGRCYIFREGVPGLSASNWKSMVTDAWSLDRWHMKTIGVCRTKGPSTGKTVYWHEWSKISRCTSVKNSECQQGNLIFDPLQNSQPVKSCECVSDVIGRSQVKGMLVGQPVQHYHSPDLLAPMLPPVTGMWPLAPNDGSVWVFEGLQRTVTVVWQQQQQPGHKS